MNKKIVSGIVAVVVILAIGGGFWKWKDVQKAETAQRATSQQNSNEQPTQQVNGLEKVDTSDWNTYRDEKYKFEIRYPKDWEIRESIGGAIGGDFLEVIVEKNRHDIGMGINRFLINKSPEDWFKETGFGLFNKKYEINGYLAYYRKDDAETMFLRHAYAIYNKQKLITFDFQEKYRNEKITGEIMEISYSQYLPDFEAMVSSIKFFD